MRNMRLNEKKCKDMVINFLKYQPTVITPIQLNGIVIERVSSYKLLGVIITNDLSWNEHCDSIHKKATKRLFVLRTLKRVGLGTNDLVLVYCSIVRSIVEYASPVWAPIPLYLDELQLPVMLLTMTYGGARLYGAASPYPWRRRLREYCPSPKGGSQASGGNETSYIYKPGQATALTCLKTVNFDGYIEAFVTSSL